MGKIIVTGSRGLIGKEVTGHLKKSNTVIEADLSLGQDLTDEKVCIDFFSKNKADYLVNLFALNHHIESGCSSSSTSLESFREYLDVNLTALFCCCREFSHRNHRGGIINFSSTYGLKSPRKDIYEDGEKHIGYTVSKHGVIGLTKHLAVHLAPFIRVNCICPGGMRYKQPKTFRERYSENTPMNRMGEPKELFGIIDYLCSDASSYTTGAVISIDGGWNCQ